jgi:hypothetical protein
MRVSKQFYEVAGPLLYKKVVIKNRLAEIMLGHSQIDRAPTKSRAASVNLKTQLLSLVEHLTIVTHTCGAVEPHFPNAMTLLIIPYADDLANEDLCQYSKRCEILEGWMQRIVIHNSRAGSLPYKVKCPVFTLSLDEGKSVRHLARQVDYRRVHWNYVQQFRIIVSKFPAWLEFAAQKESASEGIVDIQALVNSILVPAMAPVPVTVTVYLFRDLRQQDETQVNEVKQMLDKGLAHAEQQALQRAIQKGKPAPQPRKAYVIKTLSDYIAEGLEDEFLGQELKYWREENDRRLKRDDASLANDLV